MIAVLEDTQRLQLLQLDLSALTVAESVLWTSVSAVIFLSSYDRTTDNYISATSSLKTTDYYKQKQGVEFSEDLRWSNHIGKISKKLASL